MSWNEANIGRLKGMWAEGYSCAQIARALGGGISRCAVMGKVSRLKLPKPEGRKVHERKTPRPVKHSTRGVRVGPTLVACARPRKEDEPLPQGGAGEFVPGCKYIHGEALIPNGRMCGHPATGSWCTYHGSIVYAKPRGTMDEAEPQTDAAAA